MFVVYHVERCGSDVEPKHRKLLELIERYGLYPHENSEFKIKGEDVRQ